jgi:hypothetical protein
MVNVHIEPHTFVGHGHNLRLKEFNNCIAEVKELLIFALVLRR